MTTLQTKRPAPAVTKEEQPYVEQGRNRHTGWWLLGIAVVWLGGWALLRGIDTLVLPFQDQTTLSTWLNGLRDDIQLAASQGNWFFDGVIGGISDALDGLVTFLQQLISTPAPPRPVPEIGWLGVVALFGWFGLAVAGARMALLVIGTVLAFGFVGYWSDGMDTLIITTVAVVICCIIGLPLGIAMARRKSVSAAVTPVLDLMQTMPAFAYLAPLALFFGIGAASAVVCTLIYAIPPLVRITEHGIRSVPATTVEAAGSLGVTKRQLLRQVQIPMARRTIVVGVNQCTMAALSMATIAAYVNGPGLGKPVIAALQNLDVGAAAVAGLAIVLAAIMLDRTTTAASERSQRDSARVASVGRPGVVMMQVLLEKLPRWASEETKGRRPIPTPAFRRAALGLLLIPVAICVYYSRTFLSLAQFPESVNVGPDIAKWINDFTDSFVNAVDTFTNAFKNFISYAFLNPLQSLMAESPWWLMALVLLAIAFVLGGWRPTVTTAVCEAVILGTGLWNDAMVTLTMTIVATVLVMILAMLLGVWMGRSRRADTVIRPFLDTFQVIPPFVYLVPALALFSSSRFTAIIAATAYAVPIATKLVADGIRGVSPSTVEAARSAGITKRQMITKVQLPMSREALVLATNQGLLYVLSMVVIGGMVGGGSLGYLVISGFSQTQLFGKGLAAGIAITALGVMLDRIARYAAARYGRA
ncbi:MAG: ABC transporter permease subunit [Nocardioidaceae bacterium]|nr:ABC transporter permease subunit [Nocardioidaceae bacterium]NUS53156.1 ABC transporter permease subunit [Nocardioidaceae bacterium]